MLLDGFKNKQQKQHNDCLVACCQQIFEHLGVEKSDVWLWDQLVNSLGTFTVFTNLPKLERSLGMVVELHTDGTIDDFEPYIESGLPIIVTVSADIARDWPHYRDHAVVVIGFDDEAVYVNDPAQAETGLPIPHLSFLHAWQPRNYQYAVLRLA